MGVGTTLGWVHSFLWTVNFKVILSMYVLQVVHVFALCLMRRKWVCFKSVNLITWHLCSICCTWVLLGSVSKKSFSLFLYFPLSFSRFKRRLYIARNSYVCRLLHVSWCFSCILQRWFSLTAIAFLLKAGLDRLHSHIWRKE